MKLSATSLNKIYTPDQYDSISKTLGTFTQVDINAFNNLKPIALQIFLLTRLTPKMPFTSRDTDFTMYFQSQGKNRGDKVLGLETAESEINIYMNSPISEQKNELLLMLKDFYATKRCIELMYKLYEDQNIEALYKMMGEAYKPQYSPSDKKGIIKKFNLKWINQIPSVIHEQPTFINVSVFHLGGEYGLLNLLRKEGYTLTPVTF